MDTSNQPGAKIPEHSGPFLVEIGLEWFLNRFIRGVHGFATVSKEFGDYLRAKDTGEQHIHVDYPEETPGLAHIYPKQSWIEAVARWTAQKKQAELDRQLRFARDEAAKALAAKYALREERIAFFTNRLRTRFPAFASRTAAKTIRALIITLLLGKGNTDVQSKLDIKASDIEEFISLPQPQASEEDELMGLVVEPKPKEVIVT